MGEWDYGVRKRSFRPTLKLTLQHSKEGDYGVRKPRFRPTLKLRFSTPNGCQQLPSPTAWERGWG